jgi:hypothetical protein
MSITHDKKLHRIACRLCQNCGKAKCACLKPKRMGLPVGITRRADIRTGPYCHRDLVSVKIGSGR